MLRIIGDGEHAKVIRSEARLPWWKRGRIVAIGNPAARQRVVWDDHGREPWVSVIHEDASVSESAWICGGVYVGAGAVVSRGAWVGPHSIINSGAIVEHDVNIEQFVNVNPGVVIGGGAKIGNLVTLGLGCRIRDHVRVGDGVTVGMGAVVVEDVPPGVTVMGCPARIVECST